MDTLAVFFKYSINRLLKIYMFSRLITTLYVLLHLRIKSLSLKFLTPISHSVNMYMFGYQLRLECVHSGVPISVSHLYLFVNHTDQIVAIL